VRDRFNVIPSEVEGSRYVTLKVPQRDSSVRAGLAFRCTAATQARVGISDDDVDLAISKELPVL